MKSRPGDDAKQPLTVRARLRLVTAGKFREKVIALLARAIELRGLIAAFLLDVQQNGWPTAYEQAITAEQGVNAEVKKLLLSIGYVDDILPGWSHKNLTDDIIFAHPKSVVARNLRSSLIGYENREARQQNEREIESCKQQLAGLKKQALAGLGL